MPCKVDCDAYRLGDVYTGYFERHFDIARVCSFWPSSLACDLASGRVPRQLFCRSLARAVTDPGTVYVHLRLGDVLDWDVYRPRVGTYVIPVRHYNRTRLPPGVRRAAIVGNPWYRTRMTGHGRAAPRPRRVHAGAEQKKRVRRRRRRLPDARLRDPRDLGPRQLRRPRDALQKGAGACLRLFERCLRLLYLLRLL